jgi:peroxiredoxin
MRIASTFFFLLILTLAGFGQQQLKPGNAAPEFVAESLDGRLLNLNQLNGKVVVLTFWSTRCEICRVEIPKLNQLTQRFSGKDVVFLALSVESKSRIEPFLRENPFLFDIVPNSFGIVLKYADMDKNGNINMGFPAYFVINKLGQIELKANGWDKVGNLDGQIMRLLASE